MHHVAGQLCDSPAPPSQVARRVAQGSLDRPPRGGVSATQRLLMVAQAMPLSPMPGNTRPRHLPLLLKEDVASTARLSSAAGPPPVNGSLKRRVASACARPLRGHATREVLIILHTSANCGNCKVFVGRLTGANMVFRERASLGVLADLHDEVAGRELPKVDEVHGSRSAMPSISIRHANA
jgi:hypothetical protein